MNYCCEKYGEKFDLNKAESILISYLKDHDLELLFAGRGDTVLPEVKRSKSGHFLLSSYINDVYINKRDKFNVILDIALGHILASAILYNKENDCVPIVVER